MVLTGPNGAGKTNILEAVSLLAPGRGLRKARLQTLCCFDTNNKPWTVHADIQLSEGSVSIGTGLQPPPSEKERRLIKINGDTQPQTALNDWLRIIWQTPQSDSLFIEGMSTRRRFVDTLVSQVTPTHSKHLYRYEYALRERSKLLKEGARDPQWISILEETLSQEAVIIATNRSTFLEQLSALGKTNVTSFPQFHMESKGLVEAWLQEHPALTVEDKIREHLLRARQEDSTTGGSKIGVHQSEILVINLDYNRPAEVCSTGEQKALLLSMMLASCRLQTSLFGMAPILLLDEVVAHLDEGRRQSLFEEILALKVQAWLTGTDRRVFDPLKGSAQFLTVDAAHVKEEG